MSLINKMIRAAKLDAQFYEEAKKDTEATKEAFLVVLIGAICTGIESVGIMGGRGNNKRHDNRNYRMASRECCEIPDRCKNPQTHLRHGRTSKILGFAYSPNVLSILGIIPGISLIIRFIASIWVLVAFIVAVRQALNCGTVTAILISVVGTIAFMIVFATFSAIVSSL